MNLLKRNAWKVVIILGWCLTLFIYWRGLSGPLILDSYKLYGLFDQYFSQANDLTGISFGYYMGRVVSQASFIGNFIVDGKVSAYSIKLTNLLIHLACSFFIFKFLGNLLSVKYSNDQAVVLSSVATVLWLISPINISSVLYSIQRMNQLSTLFVIISLTFYLKARGFNCAYPLTKLKSALSHTLFFTFSIMAVLSKENAWVIIGYVFLLEVLIIQSLKLKGLLQHKKLLFILIPIIFCCVIFLSKILWLLVDYSERSFNLYERLMTESRIFWIYIVEIFVPRSIATGIFKDNIYISQSIFDPPTTALSIILIFAVVIFTLGNFRSKRLQLYIFGTIFFISGHLIESTVLPLELYFEHRNYLPSVGLFLIQVLVLHNLFRVNKNLVLIVFPFYIVFVCFIAYQKSVTWSDEYFIYQKAIEPPFPSSRALAGLSQYSLAQGDVKYSINALDLSIKNDSSTAFRARLQKLYVLCVTNSGVEDSFYSDLEKFNGFRSSIELSQALKVLVDAKNRSGCPEVKPEKLVGILEEYSRWYASVSKDTWFIDYYIVEFCLMFDRNLAYQKLDNYYENGQEKAKLFLNELKKQSE